MSSSLNNEEPPKQEEPTVANCNLESKLVVTSVIELQKIEAIAIGAERLAELIEVCVPEVKTAACLSCLNLSLRRIRKVLEYTQCTRNLCTVLMYMDSTVHPIKHHHIESYSAETLIKIGK